MMRIEAEPLEPVTKDLLGPRPRLMPLHRTLPPAPASAAFPAHKHTAYEVVGWPRAPPTMTGPSARRSTRRGDGPGHDGDTQS